MSGFKKNIDNAVQDLRQAVRARSIWMALGWSDIRTRYHRSRLGVFWASLSILIFVSALGPIYASFFGASVRDYTLHLLLGVMLWSYMSSVILESGREYVNSANYLSSFRLSYFTLLMRVVWRNFVVLGYQMIAFCLLAILLGLPIKPAWSLVPLALIVITIAVLWIALLVSVLATRFRDLSELLNNIFRLVFFVTPIMWMPGLNSDLNLVTQLNPFYHLIHIFRAPLLAGEYDIHSWLVVLVIAAIGWLIAFAFFANYRSRISFWL